MGSQIMRSTSKQVDRPERHRRYGKWLSRSDGGRPGPVDTNTLEQINSTGSLRSRPSGRRLLGRLTLSGLLLLLLCGLLGYRALETLSANEQSMRRSEEVTRSLEELLSTVKDAETGQRGYLLTGRDEYLQPYIAGRQQIGPALDRLKRALAADGPPQSTALEAQRAAEAKLHELDTSLSLYRTRGREAALALVMTGEGQREMDALRSSVHATESQEAGTILEHTRQSARSRRVAVLTFSLSLVGSCLLLAAIYLVLSSDLLRRERLEQSLRSSEEQERLSAAELRTLSDRIPALLSYISRDGRFVRANDVYRRWMRVNPEQIAGQPIADLLSSQVSADYWSQVAPLFERARNGESVSGEVTGTYADGVSRIVEVNYQPDFDSKGDVRGVVALVNDISGRRRTEEAQARLAAIVQSSNDAIVLKSLDGTISAWNRGAERIYGWTEAEAVGQSIYLIIPPELRDEEEQLLARVRRGERISDYETLRVRKDGSRVEMSLTISPVFDKAGRILGVSKVGRDITERKRAEAAVQQMNAELESRVKERTRELEEANDDLRAFSYSVSHDLRAPLRAIQGFADALLVDYGEQLDQTASSYLKQVELGGARMTQLIDDLLAYSRLSRASLDPRPISLRSAVLDASSQFGAMPCTPLIEVAAEFSVLAHAATLEQSIANLLSNACKFTRPGVASCIRIWAEPRGRCIRLWVEDNGIGIAPEHQESIFRVFERLHGQETYPGTGIGLAIVRRAAERMQGAAGVESELGAGSRFWLELPRAEYAVGSAPPTLRRLDG